MKIKTSKWAIGRTLVTTLGDVPVDQPVHLTTATGTFQITENGDGSLEVRCNDRLLTVEPMARNAVTIRTRD